VNWREWRDARCEADQPAGGVIDVHQQRAGRRAVLEPRVITAIDLHQLTQTRAPVARLVHLGRAQLARHPETGVDHDPAHRLGGQVDTVPLTQLLSGQGRAKVGIAVTDQAAHARLQAGW